MRPKKIAIYGHGVTGQALSNYLSTVHGKPLTIAIRDPHKGLDDDVVGAEFSFICVPVPVEEDFTQNLSMVMDCLERIPKNSYPVIRSTMAPGTLARLVEYYEKKEIAHLPEFLTERQSNQDMFNQKDLYLGYFGEPAAYTQRIQYLFPDKQIHHCLPTEAEMIKMVHNVFGATKVTFFNAVYEYCRAKGCDYGVVREGILQVTEHINRQHTLVPGPDGEFGFAGACFPVNVKAMIGSTNPGPLNDILKMVWNQNMLWRPNAESEKNR